MRRLLSNDFRKDIRDIQMPRGGARKGAGRPAGVRNQLTEERQAAIAATGETPLDYMLRILRDPATDAQRRDAMAKAAAPYCHAQLSSIKHDGSLKLMRPEALSDDELAGIAATSSHRTAETPADTSKLN